MQIPHASSSSKRYQGDWPSVRLHQFSRAISRETREFSASFASYDDDVCKWQYIQTNRSSTKKRERLREFGESKEKLNRQSVFDRKCSQWTMMSAIYYANHRLDFDYAMHRERLTNRRLSDDSTDQETICINGKKIILTRVVIRTTEIFSAVIGESHHSVVATCWHRSAQSSGASFIQLPDEFSFYYPASPFSFCKICTTDTWYTLGCDLCDGGE